MTEIYPSKLDRNGYAPSLFPHKECFICGKPGCLYVPLQRHEIFHGPNRQKSKRFGLWVTLCPMCHTNVHHQEPALDKWLKRVGQQKAMDTYGWTIAEFRAEFGKNYLGG